MTTFLPRLDSGVPGLDEILGGGFVEGSSYIVQGEPGAGKTILASQIAMNQASGGRKVLYATLLAESHERLFQSLSTLEFFDPSLLGGGITFVSVFHILREEGLDAVVALLRKEIGRQKAEMLVIDGLLSARDWAGSTLDVRTFVAELQGHAAFAGCTVLFLTSAPNSEASPEHTMVDGVLELREEIFGARSVRSLRVRKSRGSSALGGLHQLEITSRGMVVYPRLEAIYSRPKGDNVPDSNRISTGVPGLDILVGGGVPSGSITLVAGPSGSGKTTLGLCFLGAASIEDTGLYLGFHETPSRVVLKGDALGLNTSQLLASGAVEIMWQPLTENLLDALGHKLLDAVRNRNVKRLVIDGLGAFERATTRPTRLVEFVAALSNELRAGGVTTVATWEVSAHANPPRLMAPEFLSALDNLVALNQLEVGSELRRAVAVMKVRDSAFDAEVRTLSIGQGGLLVGEKFGSVEATIAGAAAFVGPLP